MIVICKKTIEDNLGIGRLFTAGATYEFIEVNNKFSQRNGYVGYIKKDDEKYKRWLTKEFKDMYFAECN